MDNAQLAESRCKLNSAREVDRLCDEYESRYIKGELPSLSEFLAQVSGEQREQLCAELVRLQLDLRRRRGDSVNIRDVLTEVPDDLQAAIQACVETSANVDTVYSVDSRLVKETILDGELPPELADFQLIERVAIGGMGVVWRMRDLRVGRDVAVKVMKSEAAHNHAVVRRFIDEAKICAQLNHPYIVPVHDVGRLADWRSYYIMKFVNGKTLSELLRGGPSEAADRMELLQIFQKVCEAIAYSHREGVMHRDLKPSNIMVGRHGEVQLMDWGLAGILAAQREKLQPATRDSVVKTKRQHATEQTQYGDIFGTPSYMAPEQARGLVSEIDATSDVFSLGAILCELLTSRPAYVGQNFESIEISAASADLDDAYRALDASNADPMLVDIARKCLAANKRARYANGDEVANAIGNFLVRLQERLEEEKLQLERDRVEESERRRRTRIYVRFAAAACLLIFAGGAMGMRLWQQHHDTRLRSSQALERITQQINAKDFVEAKAELNAASRAGLLGDHFAKFEHDIRLAERLDAIRDNYYTWQDGWFDCYTALDQYENAFRVHGLEFANVNRPNLDATKLASQIRASSVRERIVNAVDDLAWLAHREAQRAKSQQIRESYLSLRNKLLAAAQLADPGSQLKTSLRNYVHWDNPRSLVDIAGSIDPSDSSPEQLVLLSKVLPQENKEAFLTRCHVVRPSDFWINIELGRLILEEIAGSIPSLNSTLSCPATKAFSASHSLTEPQRERAAEVVAYYRAAVAKEPDRVGVRLDLAAALAAAGHARLAIIECARATELAKASNSSDKPLLSQAFHLLGLAHAGAGKLDEAIKDLYAARTHDESSAPIQWNLAAMLEKAGKCKEAEAVLKSLSKSSTDPTVQRDIEKHLESAASAASK